MFYLSLDVESSGPIPGLHSLVSVGAAPVVVLPAKTVGEPRSWQVLANEVFYVELQPLENGLEIEAATRIHGLSREYLSQNGTPPALAMAHFAEYIRQLVRRFGKAIGAGWPASFDGPFVAYYEHQYLDCPMLGFRYFDISSFGQGLLGCTRKDLYRYLASQQLLPDPKRGHHSASDDAVFQAKILAHLLQQMEIRKVAGLYQSPHWVSESTGVCDELDDQELSGVGLGELL